MQKPVLLVLTALLIACGPGRAADPDDKLVRELLAIVKDARNNSDDVRTGAIQALGRMGGKAKRAVPDLVKLLDDPAERKDANPYVNRYYYAIQALGQIGPDAREAVPSLVRARGVSQAHALAVDAALKTILPSPDSAPPARKAVEGLLRDLKDKDEGVRLHAAKSLGQMGAGAKAALPALLAAAKDPDPDVRRVAERAAETVREALGQGKDDVARLVEELRDRDEAVRLKAAKVLGRLGVAAKSAVPALSDATKDPDDDVRRVAKDALDKIHGGK
jgi:HEAT repeat protein